MTALESAVDMMWKMLPKERTQGLRLDILEPEFLADAACWRLCLGPQEPTKQGRFAERLIPEAEVAARAKRGDNLARWIEFVLVEMLDELRPLKPPVGPKFRIRTRRVRG